MFVYLLTAVLIGASIHVVRTPDRSIERMGEIFLSWILAGYCGVPMVGVAIGNLVYPERAAEILGFPPGNPFQDFLGVSYLALSVIAVLVVAYRGPYLVAPALGWAIFFIGATWIHLKDFGTHGPVTHGDVLHIFASHGLISLLLLIALVASGVWRIGAGAERSR